MWLPISCLVLLGFLFYVWFFKRDNPKYHEVNIRFDDKSGFVAIMKKYMDAGYYPIEDYTIDELGHYKVTMRKDIRKIPKPKQETEIVDEQ